MFHFLLNNMQIRIVQWGESKNQPQRFFFLKANLKWGWGGGFMLQVPVFETSTARHTYQHWFCKFVYVLFTYFVKFFERWLLFVSMYTIIRSNI